MRERTRWEYIPTAVSCYKTVIPSGVRERPPWHEDGEDWFGVYWIWDEKTMGHTPDPRRPPVIENICEWDKSLRLPNLDEIDWTSAAKADLEGYDRESSLLRLFLESGPFERLHSLVGFEEALIAMYEEPEAFCGLMSKLTDFRVKLIEYLGSAYRPDVILNMDDLASASAPLFSMDMYRKFIKSYEKRIADAIHAQGAYFLYHSCGRMQDFIDDLLEIGADGLNALTPCNDQKAVMEKYGSRFVVDGGLDSLLISGENTTEEELREEIRRACDIFGPFKRYIIHPASFIPEHKKILLDEAVKYGHTFYKNIK